MKAFRTLLKNPNLSEANDIQPFFKKSRHLTAYMATFAPKIAVATEICFEYDISGNFRADILLGSKKARQFCVVEFDDGNEDTIFKNQPKRKYPEWSSRFDHGFSQLVDWFYNLQDFKGTADFKTTFGPGHIKFTGLLIMGREAGLDDSKRARMEWRTEKVKIDSHEISCITFDELYQILGNKFTMYAAASKIEPKKKKK